MITQQQITLLESYRDKSYISSILCEKCSNSYSFYRNLLNFPLIISSSVLALLNSSSFDPETMKLPNMIVNASSALLLAILNNMKLSEKMGNFKAVGIKMNKLCHFIEDKLTNEMINIRNEDIKHDEHY